MLRIENLVFSAWGRKFFDSASVTIPSGTKVGLVGRNGVGKSTLFKLILGDLVPQGGDIILPKRARIGSVEQEHPATPVTLLDTVLAADHRREDLNAQLATAAPEELAEIYCALNAIDADRAPSRAAEIFRRLAHARCACGGAVRRAGYSVARRAHKLSRSRRRALARSALEEISQYRADRQPRPRAAQQLGRCHPAFEPGQA